MEGSRGEVHVELLGHDGRLVVDREAILVDAATDLAARGDVEQLRGEAVGDVDHGRGQQVGRGEAVDDVATRLRA